MATSKQTGTEPEQAPGTVTIDAELAARLVEALERIGTAFPDDPSGGHPAHARTEGTGRDNGRDGQRVDPARDRAARDYDVLRGLLGRAGAPRPLRMHRDRNAVVVDDPVPMSATTAVIESPGEGSTPQRVGVVGGSKPTLPLAQNTSTIPISRVELLDCHGVLVAFGPSLAPPIPARPC